MRGTFEGDVSETMPMQRKDQTSSVLDIFKPLSMFTACMSTVSDAHTEFGCWQDPKGFLRKLDEGCGAASKDRRKPKKGGLPPKEGPELALRIAYAPGVESAGACLGPFGLGDDIAVTQLEPCRGFDPLTWRQGGGGSSSSSSRSPLLPRWGDRFTAPHSFYRARVCVSDGKDGFDEFWCLLSVTTNPRERTIEVAQAAVDDAVTAASYAHRFNEHTAKLHEEHGGGGEAADSIIGVRVCVPVAAYCLGGHSNIVEPGQALTIALYPFKEVCKYVFDGSEEFMELPQAFFHYCHHLSAGREVVIDIQGTEDENGDIFIVDPVVIRPPPATVGSLLGTLVNNNSSTAQNEEKLRFDTWHPKCGQLCKVFDPSRHSAHCRRACGLAMPACGVGA